jgi:hypothetical protein
LQDENHLRNICHVARHTADLRHWLTAREYEIVRACKRELPKNLLMRVRSKVALTP